MATVTETPAETLARIQQGFSKNDLAVVMAFADAGIDPDDITPRVNVLTYRGWQALDRQVAKGAISLRVTVWIPKKGKKGEESSSKDDKKKTASMYPKTVSLFHVSQTIPKSAPKGTKPDAWENPQLVRAGSYDQ